MKHVNLDTLAWDERRSPKGRFGSDVRDISVALGARRRVHEAGEAHPFDLQQRRVPPGKAVCPLHSHAAQWEMFIFTSGRGVVRTGGGEQREVGPGDVVLHPPGTAHQTTNTGTDDLVFFIIADNPPADFCHYPDSGKWALAHPRTIFRLTEADYFDGEE